MTVRRIAIAADDRRGLEGAVSAHFGRCPAFVLVEADGDRIVSHQVVDNPHFAAHTPGAVPAFIASTGANVIIAGGMGPRAVAMFNQSGIEVATGASGRVGDALDAWMKGHLQGIVPCAHDHADSCGGHHQASGLALEEGAVAVAVCDDKGLGAAMDERFGRAPAFLIVDSNGVRTLKNEAALAAHGAGTGAASLLHRQGVRAVISGRFGPDASMALEGMHIAMWSAPPGLTAAKALEEYRSGGLRRVTLKIPR